MHVLKIYVLRISLNLMLILLPQIRISFGVLFQMLMDIAGQSIHGGQHWAQCPFGHSPDCKGKDGEGNNERLHNDILT